MRSICIVIAASVLTLVGCSQNKSTVSQPGIPLSGQRRADRGMSPDLSTNNVIKTFSFPSNSGVAGITFGPDGNVWIAETGPANAIGKVTPSGQITNYPVTGGNVGPVIVSGPGAALWFTDSANGIGRITPTGSITIFPLPSGDCAKYGIASGPDGNLWFTDSCTVSIGKITPAGVVTEYALLPAGGGFPFGITTGPDGNLWFVMQQGQSDYGKITTLGSIMLYTPPFAMNLTPIVKGPDGKLYAGDTTRHGNAGSGLVQITTGGAATAFPTKFGCCFSLDSLAVGPDKQVWMGSDNAQIEEFNPKNNGMSAVANMPIVNGSTPHGPNGIVVGPGGEAWFTSGEAGTAQYVGVYEEQVTSVGIRLNGELSINDPNYDFELGYAVGTGKKTQTISLQPGESVQFKNLDTIPHSAAFLGNATSHHAPWPTSFNGSTTQSPAGTAIGTTGWATGSLNPNTNSPIYETGLPGFYMIGCQYHYVSNEMRTVIIVH